MSGTLPTRPTADNYGPDLVDSREVEDPTRELGAGTFNAMRHDLAYLGRVAPLLVFYVQSDGVVVWVRGPEGVLTSQITSTGSAVNAIDWSATGVTGSPEATAMDYGIAIVASHTATTAVVHTYDTSLGSEAHGVLVKVW